MSDLRPALLAEFVGDDAHADAQRRAAVPLPHVQEGLLGLEHPHQAPAHPLGREALPVQVVPAALLAVGQPQQAHARARQRGCVTALAPAVPRAAPHAPTTLLSAHAQMDTLRVCARAAPTARSHRYGCGDFLLLRQKNTNHSNQTRFLD